MCARSNALRKIVWQFADIWHSLVSPAPDPLRPSLSISSETLTVHYHPLHLYNIAMKIITCRNHTAIHIFSYGKHLPNIFSGCNPRSNPTAFFSSGAFFFAAVALSCSTMLLFRFFWLSSAVRTENLKIGILLLFHRTKLHPLAALLPVSAALFFLCSSKAAIKSGQSKFSSGSHVLSSDEYPFHFKKYSTFPFRIRRSRTFSTEYSSSTASPVLLANSSVPLCGISTKTQIFIHMCSGHSQYNTAFSYTFTINNKNNGTTIIKDNWVLFSHHTKRNYKTIQCSTMLVHTTSLYSLFRC